MLVQALLLNVAGCNGKNSFNKEHIVKDKQSVLDMDWEGALG